MNYYEELGIDPSAPEEEIARAHRRLAKLMHPDQQVDDAVKKLAETQMRRLNAIVEVLTNPEKRHQYDEQLQGKLSAPVSGVGGQTVGKTTTLPPMAPPPNFDSRARRLWRALPWWVWSTAGALAMTFAISWMVADYSGSSFGNRSTDYVRPKDETENKGQTQPKPDQLGSAPHPQHNALAALNRILAAVEAARTNRTTTEPEPKTSESKPEVKLDRPVGKMETAVNPSKAVGKVESERLVPPVISAPEEHANFGGTKLDNPIPPPPPEITSKPPNPQVKVAKAATISPSAVAPKSASPSSNSGTPSVQAHVTETTAANGAMPAIAKLESQNPLAGDWIYSPKEPEQPAKGYFPPEFIELKLVSEQGLLHGQYRARYRVMDTTIQPNVDFQVIANAANSKKFSWQSSDGSKGVLKITQVDAQNIEVEWKATTKSRQPALNFGSATLTRRDIE